MGPSTTPGDEDDELGLEPQAQDEDLAEEATIADFDEFGTTMPFSMSGALDVHGGGDSRQGPVASVMSHTSARSANKVECALNEERWAMSTNEKLENAKSLQKMAVKSMMENHSAAEQAHKFNSAANVVSSSIKKKLLKTQDLCKGLEDRIESVEDTIRQVGECLFQLQRAHRCKWAPLNVAERRLELRDARPIQELVRDNCQEALEHERNLLVEARVALGGQIEKIKECLVALDRLCGELREDLRGKRQTARIDRGCLGKRANLNSSINAKDRLVLPSLQDIPYFSMPPAPSPSDAPGRGLQNEESRQDFTLRLVARALRAEEDAMRLANESDALMVSTERECTKASAQAQTELSRRVEETNQLRRQLEGQMVQTDETIAQTQFSLSKMHQSLDSHDKPLRALDKQFAARSQRAPREGARDLVHEEMEGHLSSLQKSVRSLKNKAEATSEILEQLRRSKQQMQEDYKNKIAAQKIDDVCSKVTPRKAMALDRTDPRGGRCREPARRKPPLAGLSGGFEVGFSQQLAALSGPGPH
mmetsp:Transcript_2033/g.7873  ORF Transcript_2033/g.7873 Transcript_2033/m.7873 type:complete len:535 (+) Transcript_2033:56-1660(+)